MSSLKNKTTIIFFPLAFGLWDSRVASPSPDHCVMDMNTAKVTLCSVLENPSLPAGHTMLTRERNREGAERQGIIKTKSQIMAGFIPRTVVGCVYVYARLMRMTLPTEIITAISLQRPLPRSQRGRINCNCTEDNRIPNRTISVVNTWNGKPKLSVPWQWRQWVKFSMNRNKNKAKLCCHLVERCATALASVIAGGQVDSSADMNSRTCPHPHLIHDMTLCHFPRTWGIGDSCPCPRPLRTLATSRGWCKAVTRERPLTGEGVMPLEVMPWHSHTCVYTNTFIHTHNILMTLHLSPSPTKGEALLSPFSWLHCFRDSPLSLKFILNKLCKSWGGWL